MERHINRVGVEFLKIGAELLELERYIDGVGVGVGVVFLNIGADLPGVGVVFLEIGAELPGVGVVIGGVGVRVGVGFLKIGAELLGVGAVHTRSCPSLFSANSFFDLVLRGGPS